MVRCYEYAIARLEADPSRGERLNVALVVVDDEGISVHAGRSLEKVRAISIALDKSVIERSLTNLSTVDAMVREEGILRPADRLSAIADLSPLKFSAVGCFYASGATAYEIAVRQLVERLIDPEPARARKPREKRTKLFSSIKAALRAERILARKGEGIESHRILLHEQLAEGLNADMLLQNGAMHVVQTVDASASERAKSAIQEIGVSALIFEQAKIKFGESSTRPRLIYSASSQLEAAIKPALYAAEHQGATMVNWDSRDDRVRFVVEMSSLAEPTDQQNRVDFGRVHSSVRTKLN